MTNASTVRDSHAVSTDPPDPRDWLRKLAPFRHAQNDRALIELVITVVPFIVLWLAAWVSLAFSYWLTLLLAVPAAGFLVRLFTIQHDCGHGSFFHGRRANDWVGRIIGVATLTPYAHWRQEHALHHATSGNLDRRGVGDVDTLTVREFRALGGWHRLLYRLTRSPIVVLGIGPLFVFGLRHRLPLRPLSASAQAWRQVMLANLAIATTLTALAALIGGRDLLLVQLPITWLASTIGVWLFYVQHQFEHTYWQRDAGWSVHEGGLLGSSHLDLPPLLRWFTASIGLHHVHHLSCRIPGYRLAEVTRSFPELAQINRVTLGKSFRSFRLALWDESEGRLVSFREARASRPAYRSASQHQGTAIATTP